MALEFRFPDVGEGITQGEIVRWLVAQGDRVRADQPLVEVETDKAVVEIPAPRAGRILQLPLAAGETILVGQILAVIGDADGAAVEPGKAAGSGIGCWAVGRQDARAATRARGGGPRQQGHCGRQGSRHSISAQAGPGPWGGFEPRHTEWPARPRPTRGRAS